MVMKSRRSKVYLVGLTLLLAGCSGATSFFGGGESKPAATETQTPVNGRITVQRGDTIYAVARNYGVPVRSIIDANNLEPPFALSAGQTLTLPAIKYHVAERGDTVYGVARTYGVSVTEVTQINNMQTPYALSAGQEVRLPASAGILGGPQPRVRMPGTAIQTATVMPPPTVTRPVPAQPTVATSPRTPPTPSVQVQNTSPPVVATTQPTRPVTPAAPSSPTVITTAPSTTVTAKPAVPPVPAAAKSDPYADRNAASAQQTLPVEPDPVASAQSQNLPPPPSPTAPATPPATPTSPSSASAGTQVAAVPPSNPTLPSDTPAREGGGTFLWPINGKVLSGFGPKENGLHNDGINLAAPRGTPIKVGDNGTVAYVGNELRGFGNLVLVRHADGWITAYAHCEEILVKVGEQVKRGQVVGRVGSTGGVDQPQLHFELRKGKQPVNPRSYLTLS